MPDRCKWCRMPIVVAKDRDGKDVELSDRTMVVFDVLRGVIAGAMTGRRQHFHECPSPERGRIEGTRL